MALLSVFDPDSTLLGRFHALLDPLDAFGTSMDIRIPEVSLLTFIGLLHGDGKAAVEVRPRIEEAFRVAAADAVLRTSRRIEVSAAALEDAREHQCETHERLLQSLDFESGTGEAAALYQRRSALESVCTRLRTQQAQLTGAALAIGDPMALKSEHAQLLEQRDALERQYAAIALAIETLGRADAELQSRFSPQLAQKAADYMDYLTDGRYDELVLARDLSAKARSIDDPTPRDTAYLSAGTADLLYLSVRLALCELTCPADDPCPLVLDDTLVNFDDARAGRAMALFREIAQHRQVILFTCHERDCPAQA